MTERTMYPGVSVTVSDQAKDLWPDLVELRISTVFRKSDVQAGLLETDTAVQAAVRVVQRILKELTEGANDGPGEAGASASDSGKES